MRRMPRIYLMRLRIKCLLRRWDGRRLIEAGHADIWQAFIKDGSQKTAPGRILSEFIVEGGAEKIF